MEEQGVISGICVSVPPLYLSHTFASLVLVFPDEEVLEEISEELERDIFESKRGAVKQLEKIVIIG